MERSKRPGRSRAGSRSAARLVAPMTRLLAGGATRLRSWAPLGSRLLTISIPQFRRRTPAGGVSKDWSWMRSSLTTPEIPSRAVELPLPLRAAPMASISSMKPMAPPSRRAAFRSALKNDRILRFVWP